MSGLANLQASSNIPTTVVMPLHGAVRESNVPLEIAGEPFTVETGQRQEVARLFRVVDSGAGLRVYLVAHDGYFDRPGIYGIDGVDYDDNAHRFAFFTRAALTALPMIAPSAEILHSHDWHTALAPVFLRTTFAGQPYHDGLAAVLSIHNAGFQGHFSQDVHSAIGLPASANASRAFEWYGNTNWLKGGLTFSDAVVTVSPRYANELRTVEGGFGLHESFAALGDRLVGILNGIDTETWNPEYDAEIAASFSATDLTGKRHCKAALQRAFGLPDIDHVPLFAMTSRLTTQKGVDLVLEALAGVEGAQFVFLGTGEPRYEEALAELARRFPGHIGVQLEFSDHREHELIAGADMLLMPSLFEPCGLTQMRAQLYGTLPVARRVGGLADTVEDGVTGFLFDEYSCEALLRAIERAIALYHRHEMWQRMMHAAMNSTFGWRRSGERYARTYQQAIARHMAEMRRARAYARLSEPAH